MFKPFLSSLSKPNKGEKLAENKQKESKETNEDKGNELQKNLEQKDAIIEDFTNNLKRLQAEFENYIKRADKERKELVQLANEKLISKLLVIVDSFGHAIENLNKISASKEIIGGIQMVASEFNKILSAEGLKEFHAKGCKFDPYLHEVVTCVQKDDSPEDTVIEEVQTGFKLGNKTIRYAKVISSKQKQQSHKQED